MSSPDVTLTGAADDVRGLGVSVYQDHAGVRIDAGGIEITFDLAGLQAFMHLLADAACESRLWELGQLAAEDNDPENWNDPAYDRAAEAGYQYTDPQATP